MRVGPLRSYAPTVRRKLLLGSVADTILSTLFPGAVLAGDFTQSLYRNGASGQDVSSITSIPGWNFSRASVAYSEGTTTDIVTNKVTVYNANPVDLTGVIKQGDVASTLTVVDDAAALAAVGLSTLCTSGKVYKLDNSAGTTTAAASVSGAVGNTKPHTWVVYWRGSGSVSIRLGGLGAIVGSSQTLGTTYSRYAATTTPDNATRILSVNAAAGAVVYFILPQLIERSFQIPQDIVTIGAPATFNYGAFDGLKLFNSNEPRITSKGLFIEEARTNSLTRSSPGTGWSALSASITPNADVAPNGAYTASRVTSTATTQARIEASGYTVGTQQAVSAYVKMETARYVGFGHYATSDSFATFDLLTGTVVGVTNTEFSNLDIKQLANGWYRISALWTPLAGGSQFKIFVSNNSIPGNNSAAGISALFWGVQIEIGAFPTSVIETIGAAATRAADNAYITGLGPILGAPFTLVGMADLLSASGSAQDVVVASDGTANNRISLRRESSDARLTAITAGVGQGAGLVFAGKGGVRSIKIAGRVRGGNMGASADGEAIQTWVISNPINLSRLDIGQIAGGGFNHVNGYIQRVVIFGDVDDTTLQTLTT